MDIKKYLDNISIDTFINKPSSRRTRIDSIISGKTMVVLIGIGVLGFLLFSNVENIAFSMKPGIDIDDFIFWGYWISGIAMVIGLVAIYDWLKKVLNL